MTAEKPIIAITMGDPASIGPEIAVKALLTERLFEICRPVIIGDTGVFFDIVKRLGLNATINSIKDIRNARFVYGKLDVYDLHNVDLEQLRFGEISAMAGNASFEAVKKAIELAIDGEVDATVTGPINKKSINEAGHHYAGHTEI
ncbi:MAG: 4-hydroxythreonine-4-phosphate dehydrogenase [Mucilaginibacter sp.]|nr:4-hydroxythreonine-4-phosphate dehydrogenase [Mucilaginibacter sp.]